MEELTSMKKLKWEMKKKKIKETACQKVHQTCEWCRKNKELLVVAIPTAAAGIRSVSRAAGSFARRSAVKREERDRNTRFYDHSLGMYWRTKRELKPDELLTIQRRKAAGEKYGDILSSMKLLK